MSYRAGTQNKPFLIAQNSLLLTLTLEHFHLDGLDESLSPDETTRNPGHIQNPITPYRTTQNRLTLGRWRKTPGFWGFFERNDM